MRYLTIVSLFTFLLTLPLQAVALPALYEAEVEVPDQQTGSRTKGMSKAMAAVLLKVSGSSGVDENATLATAMQQPARYVQQYSYRSEENEETQERHLFLQVRFDPRRIDELLRQAGVDVWGSARPSTLIWLGVEDGGKRVLVGANDRGLVRQIIEDEAARRALPVKLPQLDRTDLDKVRPADVWGEFLETIKGASQRYAPHAILVGRVYPVSGSAWESRWSLEYRGELIRWQSRSGEVTPLIAEAIDRVTDHMVSHFAQSVFSGSGEVAMRIEGVRNLRDYRRVINYLRSTRGVKQVVAESMAPTTMRVRIVAEGGIDSVLQTIAVGKTLAKVVQPPASALPAMMIMQDQTTLGNDGGREDEKYSVGGDVPELPESPDVIEATQPELVYRLIP